MDKELHKSLLEWFHSSLDTTAQPLFEALEQGKIGTCMHLFYKRLASLPTPPPSYIMGRLNQIRAQYQYLIDYFLTGQQDTTRKEVITRLQRQLCQTVEDYRFLFALRNRSIERYKTQRGLYTTIEQDNKIEKAKQYFYLAWTQHDSLTLQTAWQQATENNDVLSAQMYVDGLTLHLMEHFSIELLAEYLNLFQTDNIPANIKAHLLVGLAFILIQYNLYLPYFPELSNQITTIINANTGELETIVNQLIHTFLNPDATEVVGQMQDEVAKRLNKNENVRTIFLSMSEDDDDDDNESWGNPSWSADNDKDTQNPFRDRMMELYKQGADINYPNTKQLLSNPFFTKEIAHWFMPFIPEYEALGIDINSELGQNIRGLLNFDADLCPLDQYALCIAANSMMKLKDDNELPSFLKELTDLGKFTENAPATENSFKQETKSYIRNLYRFSKDNPWKMADYFTILPILDKSGLVKSLVQARQDCVLDMADHCFTVKQFALAAGLLRYRPSEPSLQHLQKLGYALQLAGSSLEAVQVFDEVLAIQNDDTWTLQHKAHCLRQCKFYEEAIECYDQLLTIQKHDKRLLQLKASCLLEDAQWAKALTVFYELDAIYPDETNTARGILWCALKTNNLELAERYAERLSNTNLANDLINQAHILFIKGNIKQAYDTYSLAKQQMENTDKFLQIFADDIPLLKQYINSNEQINTMYDALLSSE